MFLNFSYQNFKVDEDSCLVYELLPGDTLEFKDYFDLPCSGIVLSTQVEPQWRVELHNLNYVYRDYWGRRRSFYSPVDQKSIALPKEKWHFMSDFYMENRSLPENIKKRINERFNALFQKGLDDIFRKNQKKLRKKLRKEGLSYLLNGDSAEDDSEDEDDSVVEVPGSYESSSDEEEKALEEKKAERERERQESIRNLNEQIQEALSLSPTMQRKYDIKMKKEKAAQE